jgi:Tfp pilus assembly protein PilX
MAVQKRPRRGAWLVLALMTLMFLSVAVVLSRPTYADDSRI